MDRYIKAPLCEEDAKSLRAGDYVYITGTIDTARDAAHKRMQEARTREGIFLLISGEILFIIWWPSPAREGRPIGSAGQTTASRMDKYAPKLLDLGLRGMIGKGKRTKEVQEAIEKWSCLLCSCRRSRCAVSKRILASEVIAYDDLGAEAIRELEVEDFPAIVVMDCEGKNLYEEVLKQE